MRLPDWHDRLQALVRERRDEPFEWGRHDCVLWAADCVEACTGEDHAAGARGSYSDPAGALRALRARGARLPEDLAEKVLGPGSPIGLARLGDVVTADLERLGLGDARLGLTLGLCYGAQSLFVGSRGGAHGLLVLPTLSLEYCHRV